MSRRSLEERFFEKVLVVSSGCHEWQSTIQADGYGRFWLDGRQHLAHRVSWKIRVGPIPNDKWVLHKCDNRRCVNLDHLYLGTPTQNVQDKIERCPWWGNMKIPYETVEEARRLYATGLSQQKVADILGIKQVQVSRYIRGAQRAKR